MRKFEVGGKDEIHAALDCRGWYIEPGAYFLVDGGFGSSGKGNLASVLARYGLGKIDMFTSNAGPNSGHTAKIGPYTIMTQQLPVGAAVHAHYGFVTPVHMNAGSIIIPEMLKYEMDVYDVHNVSVHPCAALVLPRHVVIEKTGGAARIAGTGKGTGAALADKVNREGNLVGQAMGFPVRIDDVRLYEAVRSKVVMVETSQGFSLGINEARFAPHTTSRECTVLQAMSDGRIPASALRNVAMTVRTFPIRVGNTAMGNSGDVYPDQTETSWEALGQKPELTTVTKRVRRVFTWSDIQFIEALKVNEPDTIFIGFLDYLKTWEDQAAFVDHLIDVYEQTLDRKPVILAGYGPDIDDVRIFGW